jgi:chromosome segregation ATPase
MDEVKPVTETNNNHQSHKIDKSEQELNNFKNAIESEIRELEERYSFLTKEVKDLEESKTVMKESMESVQDNFEQINQNISDIMKKLDMLAGTCENINHINKDDFGDERESIGSIITKPLRRLAVGTVSFLYSITDATLEGASNIKEGFEDIVAEAQYENKKRRMRTAE